ncbi:MAG: ParA family protein [Myxococcaceae bacterium]
MLAEVEEYDVLDKPERLAEALRDTALAKLKLLPAAAQGLFSADMGRKDQSEAWKKLIKRLGEKFDVVLVDCPAGMHGTTQDVLCACSHALGVFKSEMVAGRNFELFGRTLAAMPEERRPQQLGVVVNMFQGRSPASVEAFQRLNCDTPASRLFETTIPRHEAFQSASCAGLPLRFAEVDGASSIAFLFDMMADELCRRLGMPSKAETPKQFLT